MNKKVRPTISIVKHFEKILKPDYVFRDVI